MTQHILTQDSSVQHTTQHLTWQYNPPPYNTSHRTPIYLTQPILTVVRFPFPEKMHNEFISMEKQFNHQGKSTCGGYCQNGFHWISRLLLLLEFPNIISIISTISSLPSSCLIPPCPIPSFTLFYLVQLKRSFHTNSSSAHTKPSDSTLASSSYLFLYTYTHIPLIPSISSSPPLSPCVCVWWSIWGSRTITIFHLKTWFISFLCWLRSQHSDGLNPCLHTYTHTHTFHTHTHTS